MTITIAIPAYNEEANIKKTLKSVLIQKQLSFKLNEILVYSDGSTDKTVQKAMSFKDNRIKVYEGGNRLGKPSCLNIIFRKFKTDVLVIIDSDMYLKNKMSLENLVAYFRYDKSVQLVGGNTQPIQPHTFIETAIANYKICRDEIEDYYSFGNTAYGAHAYLAYSRKFAKSLILPKNILNDDAYSYFQCIKKGYKFAFARNSKIMYRVPQNLNDFCKQSLRYRAGGVQLYDYFGKKTVLNAFFIPKKILLLLMLKQIIRNPLAYIFLRLFNMYFYIKTNSNRQISNNFDAKWDMIQSSKLLARN